MALTPQSEWHLILNNVDGDLAILDIYIPSGRRTNVRITSRDLFLQHKVKLDAVKEVGAMDRENAKRLLYNLSKLRRATIERMDSKLDFIENRLHLVVLPIDHVRVAVM